MSVMVSVEFFYKTVSKTTCWRQFLAFSFTNNVPHFVVDTGHLTSRQDCWLFRRMGVVLCGYYKNVIKFRRS